MEPETHNGVNWRAADASPNSGHRLRFIRLDTPSRVRDGVRLGKTTAPQRGQGGCSDALLISGGAQILPNVSVALS
jgi:hypothetical protein